MNMSKKPAETAYIHQSRDVIISEFIVTWPEISIRWYCLTPISILIAKKNFHFISSNWGERNTFLSSLEVCLKYDVVNQIKNLELKNKNEQIYFKILDARLSFVEIARVSFFCRAAEAQTRPKKNKKTFEHMLQGGQYLLIVLHIWNCDATNLYSTTQRTNWQEKQY